MYTLRVAVAITVLFGAAAAKATTYQVIIYPEILPNFYGPGEDAPDISSTQFNLSPPPYPPEFSEIDLTFTTSDLDFSNVLADNDNLGGMDNLTVDMPELNDLGPVARGDNIAPCSLVTGPCFFSYILYNTTLEYPGLGQNTMFIDISNQGPGAGDEFQINLDFPAGAGIGDATSVSIMYYNNDPDEDFTDYCPDNGCSAVGAPVVPEPATLSMTLMAGIAGWLLARCRKSRMQEPLQEAESALSRNRISSSTSFGSDSVWLTFARSRSRYLFRKR
jgi:hypothetical protein